MKVRVVYGSFFWNTEKIAPETGKALLGVPPLLALLALRAIGELLGVGN